MPGLTWGINTDLVLDGDRLDKLLSCDAIGPRLRTPSFPTFGFVIPTMYKFYIHYVLQMNPFLLFYLFTSYS